MNPDTLRRMFASGLTQAQIARALGVSDTAVYLARKRHGIAYDGRNGPLPRMGSAEIRTLLASGLNAREVADNTGYHPNYIYAKARKVA